MNVVKRMKKLKAVGLDFEQLDLTSLIMRTESEYKADSLLVIVDARLNT